MNEYCNLARIRVGKSMHCIHVWQLKITRGGAKWTAKQNLEREGYYGMFITCITAGNMKEMKKCEEDIEKDEERVVDSGR